MNTKDFIRIGIPLAEAAGRATGEGDLSRGWGNSSDFGREPLDLALETPHLFQRTLRKDGKFLWLTRQQFLSQRGERLADRFQLLDRLSQNCLRFILSARAASPSSALALHAPG